MRDGQVAEQGVGGKFRRVGYLVNGERVVDRPLCKNIATFKPEVSICQRLYSPVADQPRGAVFARKRSGNCISILGRKRAVNEFGAAHPVIAGLNSAWVRQFAAGRLDYRVERFGDRAGHSSRGIFRSTFFRIYIRDDEFLLAGVPLRVGSRTGSSTEKGAD